MQHRLIPLLMLLVAALLRLHALGQAERFHPDEALFATFARNAALNGAWLLPGELDKPPLSIYGIALSMQLFVVRGSMATLLDVELYAGEFAARMPGVFYSLLLVSVAYAVALRLYRSTPTAVLAAGLLALSPYAIAFSATAFTDGLLVLLLLLAFYAALRGSGIGSGIGFVAALASKQQALYALPLLLAPLLLAEGTFRQRLNAAARFAMPVLSTVVLYLLWQSARAGWPDVFVLAAANNAPDTLWIAPADVLPRLTRWVTYLGTFAGPMTLPLSLAALVGLARGSLEQPSRGLLLYLLGFSAFHVLVALNMYDRYPFPLLPLWALLVARGLDRLIPRRSSQEYAHTFARVKLVLGLLCALVLGGAALDASAGRVAVGSDRSLRAEIDHLADWLNARTLGAIIYDRWLGWELGYYLGQWTDKRRVYYPTPQELVFGALAQPDPAPRYFVAPRRFVVPPEHPPQEWLDALAAAGFTVTLVFNTPDYQVWELIPPSSGV